ncbi:uncharacterized protein N7482_003560 [Penicillium canariense]|uniref:Uncharacterized protein n=1 Tax=Penicillium canariense TaxID=189055 RepID=A0A9W9LP98_9EURO|nr:uncharacterized protein N7482_003560 [Penicillium canariense]KAJ5167966.1 hypothetical protein N7482_003560 [Penicillium canariense]
MSSPRKSDRASLARHHHPQSPFGRARDPSYEFDLDKSHFPTPSKQNGARPRHNYRTGTLAGAYRATSRTSMSDDGAGLGLTTSPRQPQAFVGARSPSSDMSNPPEELVDVYRRIEEDGTLADFVPLDDWDVPLETRRLNHSSLRARERDLGNRAFSEASFVNENSPRRRTSDFTRDEQRLRRVTGKDSPVFSKAKVGTRAALTADNLQRREEEEQNHVSEEEKEEEEGERGPPLNLPRTWGSRAGRRSEWPRNVSGSTSSEPQEKREEQAPLNDSSRTRMRAEDSAVPKSPMRSFPRAVERSNLPARSALGERTANIHMQETHQDKENEVPGWGHNAPQGEGAPIPNTPIVVFKNSTFTKPSATKRDSRDSQDLLRKLSRTESPKLDQMHTPDPPKLFERRIYDKTPRVTGAWIDTPMTERITELPQDLTKDIVPSAASPKEPEPAKQQPKLLVDVKSKAEETKPELRPSDEPVPEVQPAKPNRAPLIRPKLPKSALETVIEDVSSGKETLDLGDDTIESLQAIMDDPTELKTEEEEEAAYAQEVIRRLELANANGQDSVDIDRLNDKLHSLVRNINEVKKGLDSLEEHVTRDAAIVSRPSSPKLAGQQTLHSQSSENCDKCIHNDGRVYAAIPLPRLWRKNPASGRRELTKLGLFTLVSLSWYIIECMMWDQYSHPLISETCDGYCMQADAPNFPFVTVTMLWRWSHLGTVLAPIATIFVAFFRLVAQLLGLWDGYVDEPEQLVKIMGEIRVNGTPVSFPWLVPPAETITSPQSSPPPPQQPVWTPRNKAPSQEGEDQGSMDDDEYL